ncbi:MAG: Ig-like domain-containing protein [Candidatus Cloacimonetes bacterium]|nr:Ig-like domain-containing protein [Candidatus Cloacimonadota bacterium]
MPVTSILFDGIVIPDTIAPKIIYTKPGNGTTIDNLLPEIEIMFSEIILAENFNATLTNVEKHKEIPLKIIQGDSKRFMVNPLKNLQNYSSYNFNLTISDASGNYLQKENLFTFIPIIR